MKKLILFITALFILSICTSNLYSQPRYYKAQMHCHTTNSDGGYSPQDLAVKYKNAGYEILMITDHNYLTLENEVSIEGMLVIQAEELTFNRHMNGFFLSELILPDYNNYTCEMAINDVKNQNGLIQLNHYCPGPFTEPSWVVYANEILNWEVKPDMLEIWNTGTESVQSNDDKTVWDSLLTAGVKIWGSATDDFHPAVIEALEFNRGWNMIWLDSLCKDNVFNSLKNGDFYASTEVIITKYEVNDFGTYKTINIESSNANKITFWGPNHKIIQETNGSSASFILNNHSYIRIELTKFGFLGIGNTYAWTQPVFLSPYLQIVNSNMNSEFTIYPNPAEDFVSIAVNIKEKSKIKLSINDLLGRELISIHKGNVIPDNYYYPVSLNNLKQGLYILVIEVNNIKHSKIFEIKKN